jgi:hypothetical protein
MPQWKVSYPVSGVEITREVKSVSYKKQVNALEDLHPGCVASACIELVVFGDVASAPLPGTAIDLSLYNQVTETWRYLGRYFSDPSVPGNGTYSVTAYDIAQRLDKDFSGQLPSLFPSESSTVSLATLVQTAGTTAGVNISLPSNPLDFQVKRLSTNDLTCRDVLSYAGEIWGVFWDVSYTSDTAPTTNDDGTVTAHRYEYPGAATSIGPMADMSDIPNTYAYKLGGFSHSLTSVADCTGVIVHPPETNAAKYSYPTDAGSNPLHIRNNILLTGQGESVCTSVAQNAYQFMTTAATRHFAAEMSLFPAEFPFWTGKRIDVVDANKDYYCSVMSMGITISDEVATISSTGNPSLKDTGQDEMAKTVRSLSAGVGTGGGGGGSGYTHVVISRTAYEALTSYDVNTIYLIYN